MKPLLRGSMLVGTLAVLTGMTLPATSFATGTCYAVRIGAAGTTVAQQCARTPLAIRYLAGSRGPFTTQTEIDKFGHLSQTVYEVDGKSTLLLQNKYDLAGATGDGIRVMSTATGTIITGAATKNSVDGPGAHMGLTIHLVRFVDGILAGPIFLECTSSEVSPRPAYWRCIGELQIGVDGVPISDVFGLSSPVTLSKVNGSDVPACSVFEDGDNFPVVPDAAINIP